MPSKPCAIDCECGKHKPRTPEQNFKPKCKPDRKCRKHIRTAEHNEKIRRSKLQTELAKRNGLPRAKKRKRRVEKLCPVIELNAVQVITRLYEPRKVTQK